MAKQKAERPEKPYPEFPMFASGNGQWAKKIRSRLHYFGSWRQDPKGEQAFKRYRETIDFLRRGEVAPEVDGLTVGDAINRFLHAKNCRVEAGQLSLRTMKGYLLSGQEVVKHLDRHRAVESLRPADLSALRLKMSEGRGPVALGNHVRHVRSWLKWLYDMELVDKPIRTGPDFKMPTKADLRRERQRLKQVRGDRSFTSEELQAILAATSGQLRAMVLLGINCAFGASDIAMLPKSAVDLKSGWIDFPRPKTAVERRIPLWPETIEALREVMGEERKPAKNPDNDRLVFLTSRGNRWVRVRRHGADIVTTDAVQLQFVKVLTDLKIKRHGVSFYALRHTARTIGTGAKDDAAIDRIMGHADQSMGELYTEQFPDDRLRNVVDYIHRWLWQAN